MSLMELSVWGNHILRLGVFCFLLLDIVNKLEVKIGGRAEIILNAIRKNSTVMRKQLLELLSCSEQTVLNGLAEKGIIERVSSNSFPFTTNFTTNR